MSDIVERLELEGGALLSEGAAEIVRLRAERDAAISLAERHMDEKHHTQQRAAEDWDVLQQRIKTAEAETARLREQVVLLEATGAEAADEIDRLRAALLEARREGFLAALVMAERRCMDAATYVRTRARTNEDHSIANTYEQAGTMVRAVPVPEDRA